MSGAANGTTAIMRARLTGLIGRIVGLILGRSPVVTDRSRMQGIGGGDAGGPTCSDRRQDLHRQGNQDDRKKFPQPPAHRLSPPFRSCELIMQGGASRDQVRCASGAVMDIEGKVPPAEFKE